MKQLIALCILLTACSTAAEARRSQIEAAEDKFCALRAKEKQLESKFGLETDTGEAGTVGK